MSASARLQVLVLQLCARVMSSPRLPRRRVPPRAGSRRLQVITQDDFYDCFFQLADLYTDGVSATDYARWIHKRVNQIAAMYTGPDAELLSAPEWEWRTDAEIIGAVSTLHPSVHIPVHSRLGWEVYFNNRLIDERKESAARIQVE